MPDARLSPTQWLHQLLDIMVEQNASDLLISVGAPPSLKMPDGLVPLGQQCLTPIRSTNWSPIRYRKGCVSGLPASVKQISR
ncbi:hypothetical protein HORIV_05150 [Vreelandella olivaria]|uniref:Uncharacterized protein n=1 Tax=Vreelandella olivaria TaxID=390919 RepID=A0ABM7GCF1_9GAMM|nr:hypothetical protein HORIV_05150 [Halomonas olivaria]